MVPHYVPPYFDVGLECFQIIRVGLVGGVVEQVDLLVSFNHHHCIFLVVHLEVEDIMENIFYINPVLVCFNLFAYFNTFQIPFHFCSTVLWG